MRVNRLKQLWREDKAAIGAFVSIPHSLAAEKILQTCRKHKVVPAMHTASSKYTQRYIDQGFKMVMLTSDRIAITNYVKAEVGRLTGWTPLDPNQAPSRGA